MITTNNKAVKTLRGVHDFLLVLKVAEGMIITGAFKA